jgi:hypothetical protein
MLFTTYANIVIFKIINLSKCPTEFSINGNNQCANSVKSYVQQHTHLVTALVRPKRRIVVEL